MESMVRRIGQYLTNVFFPLTCVSCGIDLEATREEPLCRRCLERIRPNPRPHCRKCGRTLVNCRDICPSCRTQSYRYIWATSGYIYEGPLKEAIHAFKYRDSSHLGPTLTGLLQRSMEEDLSRFGQVSAVAFVPAHPGSQKKRGFNPAKVLAEAAGRTLGIAVEDALDKVRRTRSQNELGRQERLSNLTGAFRSKEGCSLRDKAVLLVDDVMTTGSTLDGCAGALLDAGARQVCCLTLARGA